MKRALPAVLLALAACSSPRYTVVEPPAQPLGGFGSLEVKEVVVPDKAHKDVKAFAAEWMTRNARRRLPPLVQGAGPKLVATLEMDPSGLKQLPGGWIHPRWTGDLALTAVFRTDQGAPVARVAVAVSAKTSSGGLEPVGDRLLDGLADFLADAR
jgi:hypothetical protein